MKGLSTMPVSVETEDYEAQQAALGAQRGSEDRQQGSLAHLVGGPHQEVGPRYIGEGLVGQDVVDSRGSSHAACRSRGGLSGWPRRLRA